MPDPYHPSWRPEYTGDDSLGEVGRGDGFGADLYALWRAGRKLLPAIATKYAEMCGETHRTQTPSQYLFTPPHPHDSSRSGGMEPVHALLEEMRDELQIALRESAINMRDTGTALVRIANLYAATDEEAAEAFADLVDKFIVKQREDSRVPNPADPSSGDPRGYLLPPDVPDPPAPDDPPPAPQEPNDGHLQ